jgi:hypothetical protein
MATWKAVSHSATNIQNPQLHTLAMTIALTKMSNSILTMPTMNMTRMMMTVLPDQPVEWYQLISHCIYYLVPGKVCEAETHSSPLLPK